LGLELCPVRSIETETAGGSADGPPSFVDENMMVTAEEDQIVDLGLTAVRPMGEMVDVEPVGGLVTIGERTSQIPGADRGS
jgi:hypothetical protein